MICHNRTVQANWISLDDVINYNKLISDAFEILALQKERIENGMDRIQQIEDRIEFLTQQNDFEEKLENHYQLFCVNAAEENQEIILYKIGKTFSNVVQRPGRFQMTTVSQIRSKGSQEIAKNFGDPLRMEIQSSNINNPPWEKSKLNYQRIIFTFKKHSLVWIYFEKKSDALKWWNYLKAQQLIKSKLNLAKEMPRLVWRIKERIYIVFRKLISREAYDISEQRKLAASLTDKERKFVSGIENSLIIQISKQWLKKSNKFQKQEIQLKCEQDSVQQPLIEKMKQSKLLKVQKIEVLKSKSFFKKSMDLECLSNWIFDWLDICKGKNLLNEDIYQITLKSINIDESINVIKPYLEVSVQIKNFEIAEGDKTRQRRHSRKQRNYFTGQIKGKRRENYINWSIEQFNDGSKKLVDTSDCSLRISRSNEQVFICFSFVDQMAIFEETNSEFLALPIQSLFQNVNSGKSLWVPLVLLTKTKEGLENEDCYQNGKLSKQSVLLIEIDLIKLPSLLKVASYEEELNCIVENNLPIADPIYAGTLKLPEMHKDQAILLIESLKSGNENLKENFDIYQYLEIIYYDDDQRDENIKQLKIFAYRRIIENNCHLFSSYPKQLCLWEDMQEKLQKTLEIISESNKEVFVDAIIQLSNQLQLKDVEIWQLFKELIICGIPNFMRLTLWFTLLNGPLIIQEIKEYCKKKYCIFVEQRFLHKEEFSANLPNEFSWLYYKLSQEVNILQPSKQQLIQDFLQQQSDKNALINADYFKQLERILQSFLLLSENYQNQSMNRQFIDNIFLIGQKLLSLSNYQYIKFRPRWTLIEDQSNNDEIVSLDNQVIEIENESYAFWLMVCFFKSLQFPFFETSYESLRKNCQVLLGFLTNNHPDIDICMKILNISIDDCCDTLINLHSNLFLSEQLYRIWDLLIYENVKISQNQSCYLSISILGELIIALKSRICYFNMKSDFLLSLQLEGSQIKQILIVQLPQLQNLTYSLEKCFYWKKKFKIL